MKNRGLPFRQIHLDFHTSPHIRGVGAKFDKREWQSRLQDAAVNSITCFSKCHHGWSYHPTSVGKTHPSLEFNLLRAQFDACKEVGINVQIYLSAGVDDLAAHEHPEWREFPVDGGSPRWSPKPLEAGFKTLDFHSPYLDYLCAQIEEAVQLFPECDGVFLDIISQVGAGGRWSMDYMLDNGLDPTVVSDRKISLQAALKAYYEKTTAAARRSRADMPVFHNSGHITRGDYSVLKYQGHLELESLPTGGWGYDHFPESAKYVVNLGKEFLGMTGKFHTTWGEFGGYKHPNALRYECSAMISYGARCSVGDQLHPCGMLDGSTYDIIGNAYREIEAKEEYCIDAVQVIDVGVLSSESENQDLARQSGADTGAARVLLEEHILFAVLDRRTDFSRFRLIVLPDDILVDEPLADKLNIYLNNGGRVMLTGQSGLRPDRSGFALNVGAEQCGESELQVDYVLPSNEFRPSFLRSPFVMYFPAQRVKAIEGRSMGEVYEPCFNRTFRHYCSHQHAPPEMLSSGYDCGVIHVGTIYLAHPVFSIYRAYGAVCVKEYVAKAMESLLDQRTVKISRFPSTARVTLTRQEDKARWVLHLLFANTISRGGQTRALDGSVSAAVPIEVIEDFVPCPSCDVAIRVSGRIKRVTLEPQGLSMPFEMMEDEVRFEMPEFVCHQMIVLWEH